MTLFELKINPDRMKVLDGVMADHKDICEKAKCAIERKGTDLATFIRDKLSFREKRH